jgi:hypothetical protein
VPRADGTTNPAAANAANPLGNIGGTLTGLQECSRTFIKNLAVRQVDFEKLAQRRIPAVPDDEADNAEAETAEGQQTVSNPKERTLRRELMASTFVAMMVMFLMNSLMKIVPELTNDLTGQLSYTPNYFNVGGQWQMQQMLSRSVSGQVRNASSQSPGGS